MTTVMTVRGLKRHECEADPSFVYVGRAVRFTTWTTPSPWANPFTVAQHGAAAFDLHRDDIFGQIFRNPRILDKLRAELRGKVLGCWCGWWAPSHEKHLGCHAVTLAQLADGTIGARARSEAYAPPGEREEEPRRSASSRASRRVWSR